jgi:hypothetical protein
MRDSLDNASFCVTITRWLPGIEVVADRLHSRPPLLPPLATAAQTRMAAALGNTD